MKKFLTLLLPLLTAFAVKSSAQTVTDCNADFTFSISGYTAYFQPGFNTDSAYVTHTWNFGDGSAVSNDFFAHHVYATTGSFIVTHTVVRKSPNAAAVCEKSISQTITIVTTVPVCNLISNFGFKRDSIQTNKVYFTNLTSTAPNIDIVKWSFGDSTYSTENNPSHVYAASGLYTVCLSVTRNNICKDDTCQQLQVQVPVTNNCTGVAYFSYKFDSSVLYKIDFTNQSTLYTSADSIRWSFGDGTYSTDINPSHTYTAPGAYNVCIRVKKNTIAGTVPCVKEFCKIIYVSEPCRLQAYFSYKKDSIAANPLNSYRFQNESTPLNDADSTFWNFGDGTPVLVNAANPLHAFTAPGTYNVCLTVKHSLIASTARCVSTFCKTIVVGEPQPCNLNVSFSSKADSVNHNKIFFTNQTVTSNTTATAVWSFGDGSTITSWNSYHIYSHAGSYTVCLTVKQGDTCVREYCKEIVIDSVTPPPPPCNIIANYSFKRDSLQPNKLYFFDLSSPVSSAADVVKWSFGDGTYSSDINPVHVFTASGAYNVCLVVYRNNTCSDDTCHLVQVEVPNACNLVANFSSHADSVNERKIYFTNLSNPVTSIDSVSWSFGDGSYSTDVNPSHIYNVPGNYNVCIRVKKVSTVSGAVPCVKEFCQAVVVKDSCRLVVDFTYRKDSMAGIALNTYHFVNTSSPMATTDPSYWNFGDGSPVVVNVNEPTHVFTAPGNYIVCLTVNHLSSTATSTNCVRQICKTVVVEQQPPVCNFDVNFTWKADSVNHHKITFANSSLPVNTTAQFAWSFGDGTGSNGWNADHIFSYAGTYTVCLKMTLNNTCTKEICKEIKIDSVPTVDSCHLQVNFVTTFAAGANGKVYFTNTTLSSAAGEAYWSFGDGITAITWNAEHQYAHAGKYNVCLVIKMSANCVGYKCDTIVINVPVTNCDSLFATYEYRKDSYMPNKVYFLANTNITGGHQVWVVNKQLSPNPTQIVDQNNPVYVFKDTGTYNVCLIINAPGGCVKYYCRTVNIESIATTSQCVVQAYPNPAQSEVNINLELAQVGPIKISVFNLLNVLVAEDTQQGIEGNNLVKLNIGGLVSGYYTIRAVYGNNVCYSRFQKL